MSNQSGALQLLLRALPLPFAAPRPPPPAGLGPAAGWSVAARVSRGEQETGWLL